MQNGQNEASDEISWPINLDTYFNRKGYGAAFVWAANIMRHPHRAAAAMFPHRPPGYRKAAVTLARYAENRGAALFAGSIGGDKRIAQEYMRICDTLLESLPPEFHWTWAQRHR